MFLGACFLLHLACQGLVHINHISSAFDKRVELQGNHGNGNPHALAHAHGACTRAVREAQAGAGILGRLRALTLDRDFCGVGEAAMSRLSGNQPGDAMTLTVTISLDDAALQSDLSRELRALLDTVRERVGVLGFTEGQLHDSNGNTVGAYSVAD